MGVLKNIDTTFMYVEVGIERNKSIFTHISLFEEVKLAKIIPSGNIKSFYSISLHLNDHENPTYQFQTFPVNSHIYRETDVLYLVNSISELELLQPLFIASDRTIISGHRRFSAIRPLGWEEVLCKIKEVPEDQIYLQMFPTIKDEARSLQRL